MSTPSPEVWKCLACDVSNMQSRSACRSCNVPRGQQKAPVQKPTTAKTSTTTRPTTAKPTTTANTTTTKPTMAKTTTPTRPTTSTAKKPATTPTSTPLGGFLAHQAGRITERGLREQNAMKAAAAQGCELGDLWYAPEGMNNSFAALAMEPFRHAQRAYYEVCLAQGCAAPREEKKSGTISNAKSEQKDQQGEQVPQIVLTPFDNAANGNIQRLACIAQTDNTCGYRAVFNIRRLVANDAVGMTNAVLPPEEDMGIDADNERLQELLGDDADQVAVVTSLLQVHSVFEDANDDEAAQAAEDFGLSAVRAFALGGATLHLILNTDPDLIGQQEVAERDADEDDELDASLDEVAQVQTQTSKSDLVETQKCSEKKIPCDRSALCPGPIPLGAKPGSGAVAERIARCDSVEGSWSSLLYTHATEPNGLMGILSSRRFVANVEVNVNFRYDIDTRYCGGIIFVMQRGFEDGIPQTIYHDHYYKEAAVTAAAKKSETVRLRLGAPESLDFVRPNPPMEQQWAQMLAFCDAHSDFREHQPPLARGTVKGESGTYPITNYYRSITNPQIRIPWITVDISLDNVAAVLVPCHIDAEIEQKVFETKLKGTFANWRNSAPKAPTGKEVKVKLSLKEADALARYRNGKKEGLIRIYHGPSAGQQAQSTTTTDTGGGEDVLSEPVIHDASPVTHWIAVRLQRQGGSIVSITYADSLNAQADYANDLFDPLLGALGVTRA